MDTISRVLSISPSRQRLKSPINHSQPSHPIPSFPPALYPHPGLMYGFALLQRLQGHVDAHLIDTMHHFLLECSDQFRDMRSPRQLGRLLAGAALLKRSLTLATARQPEKRHIRIAYSRLQVHFPFVSKAVLGVLVIFNNRSLQEVFGKTHFTNAVQAIINESKPITLGFIHRISFLERYTMAYLEFEKGGGSHFRPSDIQILRARLVGEIEEHIQPLVPHIHCQRNDEEVYRNAIALCHELRSIDDIPQVMINYEQLQADDLIFTILLARPSTNTTLPLQKLWMSKYPSLPFISERTTFLDHFQSGQRKEISIFKVLIPQKNFQFKNHSIDIHAARRFIEQALKEMLGDFRDYNGGLILKQEENLQKFLKVEGNHKNRVLMGNFFFSIQPLAMQCTLLLELLQSWYGLIKQALSLAIREHGGFSLHTLSKEGWLLLSVQVSDASARPILEEVLSELSLASHEKATSWLQESGSYVFSCAYLTYDATLREIFLVKMEKALKTWELKVRTRQHLRINLHHVPYSLDPHPVRHDDSIMLIPMLFDGLLRRTPEGNLQMSIAESVIISPDEKTYIFTLRKTKWSNGEPLTARDVVYSWKKALDPRLGFLFAHKFYSIKNARAAHRGTLPMEAVGVYAEGDLRLRVELESKTPHFLENAAHWTYSIISSENDNLNPGWTYEDGQRYICNGPFILHSRRMGQPIVLFKNLKYWDAESVKLEKISAHTVQDPRIEKEMFLKGEIDLLSNPLDNFDNLTTTEEYETIFYELFSIAFLRCNTHRFPFNHQKMRQTLRELLWCYRDRLAQESEILFAGAAHSLIPKELSLCSPPSASPTVQRAFSLFDETLSEFSCKREDLPTINLLVNLPSFENLAYAIARLLRETLSLDIDVHKNKEIPYFKKPYDELHDHLTLGVEESWIQDPLSILKSFKQCEESLHGNQWEDSDFTEALQQASQCIDFQERKHHVRKAENVLLHSLPIIPLFQKKGLYSKKRHVHNVLFSCNGEIDLKWAYLN